MTANQVTWGIKHGKLGRRDLQLRVANLISSFFLRHVILNTNELNNLIKSIIQKLHVI